MYLFLKELEILRKKIFIQFDEVINNKDKQRKN